MLDHIVLAGPDLAAAVALFADLTGVQPVPGGRHQGIGTANYLAGLGGDAYLEIIGPDPGQPQPRRPRPFGIDDLTATRVVTWAIHPGDLEGRVAAARASGYDPGPPLPMSRATPDGEVLRWRLTSPDPATGDGLVPFLIDWGGTPHPATRSLPLTPLVSFGAIHPSPDLIRSALGALGADLPVRAGNRPVLTAVVEGQHGPVVLT